MIIFLISAAITVFLLVVAVLVMLTGRDPVEARLMEVSAYTAPDAGTLMAATPSTGLARAAATIMSFFKPFGGLVSGFDQDLAYKLTLAGFRKPEHLEIFTADETAVASGGNRSRDFRRQQHGNCGAGWRGHRVLPSRSCSFIPGDSPPNQYPHCPAGCARFAGDLHGSRTRYRPGHGARWRGNGRHRAQFGGRIPDHQP